MITATILSLSASAAIAQISPTPVSVNSQVPKLVRTAAGSPMTETATVQCPLPSVAPAFGNVLEFAGDRLVISGACIVRQPGADGQIATFELHPDGTWKTQPNMPQVTGLRPEEFVLQRIACNADTLVTPITRKSGSSDLVWFARVNESQTWKQMGMIKAPPGASRVNFGGAIAMQGNLLAVNEVSVRPGLKDEQYLTSPKVYLFERTDTGWKAAGSLQRDETKKPWWFGASLAISGDTLVVGFPAALQPFQSEKARAGNESPKVCVYRRGDKGWGLEQELESGGLSPFFGFGNRVAIEGDLMAVQSLNPFAVGADVFVYRRTDGVWNIEAQLVPGADVTRGRGFGFALQVSGGRVIVGDSSAEEAGDKSGRVFVFEKVGTLWIETTRLKPKIFCAPASFGSAVAAKWPWIAVGRVHNERLGVEPGGAYMFDMRTAPPPPAPPAATEPPAQTKRMPTDDPANVNSTGAR